MRILITVVLAVAAGAIFFFYTKPTYDGMQATQAQVAQYNAALDKATELQQLKQTLLSRYNSFDPAQIDRLQKLLPDHVDNIALILELDSLASKYGLALENVDVSTPSDQAAQTAAGAIGAASQSFDSLTLKFSTQGTYDDFIKFMTDLQSSLRVVDLVSLSLASTGTSVPQAGQAFTAPVYTYSITLRTYWLK